jgi:hypothetical protein
MEPFSLLLILNHEIQFSLIEKNYNILCINYTKKIIKP